VFLSMNDPNRRVGELRADVGRQTDSILRKPLAIVGLKLPAAVAGRRTAAKIDVRLICRLATAVQSIARFIADLRGPPGGVPFTGVPGVIAGVLEHLR